MSLSVTGPVATPPAPAPVAPQKPAAAAAAPQPVLTPVHADTVSISSAAEKSAEGHDGGSDAS